MPDTTDPWIRHLQAQNALLKVQAEQSLRSYVEQAWPVLEPDQPFLSNWHIDYLA